MATARKIDIPLEKHQSIVDFFSMLQFTCSSEMTNHAGCEFSYKDLTSAGDASLLNRNFMSGYWMGLIMLAGNNFQTTIKIFYSTDEVKSLLASRFRKQVSVVDDSLVTDFMSEFCNLAAGGSKRALEKANVSVGISLPVITRSFDDLFNFSSDVLHHEHTFELYSDNNSFRCAVEFTTATEQAFIDYRWTPPELVEEDDDDDMEFL